MKRLLKKPFIYLSIYSILVVFTLIKIYPEKFPVYANQVFQVNIEFRRIVLSTVVCISMIINTSKYIEADKTMSNLMVALLNCFYFIPGLIFLTITGGEFGYYLLYIGFWFALILLNTAMPQFKIHVANFISENEKRKLYAFFMMYITIFSIGISLYLNGFNISAINVLDISSVLEMRYAFREVNIHWIIWYFILFASNIVPIWVIICLRNKRYLIVIVLIFAQISMYSISANRIFLFSLLLAIFIYFFGNNYNFIYIFFIACYLAIIIEYKVMGQSIVITDTIRRISYVPNIIGGYYYDFFTKNQPDYLRQFFSGAARLLNLESPYSFQIPTLIGSIYSQGNSNYNTGLVGAGMGNYGYMSVIISPLLHILSFRILDTTLYNFSDKKIRLAIAFILSLTLINTNQWFEMLLKPSFLILFYISLIIMPSNLTPVILLKKIDK